MTAIATSAVRLRPVPERIRLLAFPDAGTRDASGAGAAAAPGAFFVVQADCTDVRLSPDVADWLSLSPPTPIATGLSRVDYRADDNVRAARRAPVTLTVRGRPYTVTFEQQPGDLVQLELVRTLGCPLNLDVLVAVGFVAGLIQKIPVPPVRLLVLVVAILALIALGFVVAAVRHGFAAVPEPQPLSTDTGGLPVTVIPGVALARGLPLPGVVAEDQTIALQTLKAIYWLIKQVA